jgi:hypothetical protein
MFVNKGQQAIIISGMLIALLAVAIPLSSESFAKPDKCPDWPDCPGKGGGGGKTSFDFDISLSSNSISIGQGPSTINVLISHVSGSGNVNLSAADVPSGVTVSFDPTSSKISSRNLSFTSIMTIDVSSTAVSGTIDVQATGKGTTKSTPLVLTISDTTPPQTTINSNPTNPSNDNTPSFTFSADEAAIFQCDVDGSGFAACTSGDSFGPLADSSHTFTVKATDTAGNTDSTPASYTWTIDTTLPQPNDPVIVAAGDIACNSNIATTSSCHHKATSDLIMNLNPTAVLTLGDNQYQSGELENFNTYYDPTWGRAFDKTYPSPGNHDYSKGPDGYFDYFGAVAGDPTQGYYSFDIGSWHIISLNSNCSVVDCGLSSDQGIWLETDLFENTSQCTLAYWHHPRFSSGYHGNDSSSGPFWEKLHDYKADVVLVGHDHNYERFGPQDPSGSQDDEFGITQFVVGTGGKSLRSLNILKDNSLAFDSDNYGVLKLTLRDTSYDWEFIGEPGSSFTDIGTGNCILN